MSQETAPCEPAIDSDGNLHFVIFEREGGRGLLAWTRLVDGVYCRYFLEHLRDPLAAVEGMARCVRPGGWVCAYEWENACFTSYPACPTVLAVWGAACQLQDQIGGNGHMGRELFRVFSQTELRGVTLSAHAFALTAGEGDHLAWYVESAREILGQTRQQLVEERLLTPEMLARAEEEYEAPEAGLSFRSREIEL
jgi:ubiquinone/menaquinone biosynthesis C-methylase UbiE